MPTVKYRVHGHHPPPQPIKFTVPGWTGAKDPRADGSHEQPWHCIPFSENARYGVELLIRSMTGFGCRRSTAKFTWTQPEAPRPTPT